MSVKPISGRSAFLQLLLDEGVTHLFGNPGTTELPLMEAVPDFPQLRYVLGLQESIVLGMADGYARASGRLAACNLHCAPGLGHAMGALYNAKFSGSPLIVTAGQYEQGYGLTEPLLYEPLVSVAQPLVKWAVEVERVQDLPRIVHRAAKIALAPPMGPVFISLPGSILDDEGEFSLGRPTRVELSTRPSDDALDALARRLLAARRPVILAGQELARRDAFGQAQRLAELLGAAVYHEPVPYNARFPVEHPAFLGDITRSQPKVRATLEQYDLLVCLGADLLRMSPYSPVEPLPESLPVVHVTERSWELGKNYPTDMALCADVRETLDALLPRLQALQDAQHAGQARERLQALAQSNWSAQRLRLHEQIAATAAQSPIAPDYAVQAVVDALPPEAVVVEEALTSAATLAKLLPVRDRHGFYGLASGGLGFGMAGAVGIALAQAPRPVVAMIGDGSALYSIQALWTAAHLRLPITYVIVNNRSYRIIKDRLLALRKTDRFVAMDMNDPPIDYVAVAQGFGMRACRVDAARQIGDAVREAVAGGQPALVEIMVDTGYPEAAPGRA